VVECIITGVHNEAVAFLFDNSGSHFEHCCILRHGGNPFNSPNGAGGPPGIGELVTTNANGDSCDIYGNIYLGPFFVDPIAGDFHLGDWSPCIGAGQAGGPDEDIEGHPRPNPPGSLPDIGAYENTLAAPVPYQGLSGSLSGVLGPGIYRVGGIISVSSGATLRLLPGTTLLFGGPFAFEIRGTLLAEGTMSDSILFTSDGPLPEPWRGLRFVGSGSSSSQLGYCVFEYALADSGAGIYCNRSAPSFSHCIFRYNRATSKGGGGCCVSSSSPTFTQCAFVDNEAADGGGAYCSESTPSFTECSFLSNTAWGEFAQSYGGGAVSCDAALSTFTQCLFSGNFSDDEGGAIRCRGNPSPNFSYCSFNGNRGTTFGGAVSCWTASPSFIQCSFSGNYGSQGGAIFCSFQSSPILSKCTIDSNSSGGYGGGVCCYESTPILTNCVLHANHGGRGAVYCEDSSPNFTNCTLVGNWASEYGTVYCRDSWPTFNSTIIAFSGGEAIYFQNSATSQIIYCDFFSNPGGNFTFLNGDSTQGPPQIGRPDTINANGDSCDAYHNIFLDPEFLSSDDFHLQANSPCIDAGDPNLPLDPDTTVADVGAFYFDQLDVIIRPSPVPTTYVLHQNYPNPFNSTTQIRFDIPQAARVELKIYNILGQEVATLASDFFPAGTHRVSWDATSLPSGIYIYQFRAGDFVDAKKMVLIR
jgi:predicted outer membrane repeat protein